MILSSSLILLIILSPDQVDQKLDNDFEHAVDFNDHNDETFGAPTNFDKNGVLSEDIDYSSLPAFFGGSDAVVEGLLASNPI